MTVSIPPLTGQALMHRVMPIIRDIRKMSVAGIPDVEFDIFLSVLDKIWENYDRYESNRYLH